MPSECSRRQRELTLLRARDGLLLVGERLAGLAIVVVTEVLALQREPHLLAHALLPEVGRPRDDLRLEWGAALGRGERFQIVEEHAHRALHRHADQRARRIVRLGLGPALAVVLGGGGARQEQQAGNGKNSEPATGTLAIIDSLHETVHQDSLRPSRPFTAAPFRTSPYDVKD